MEVFSCKPIWPPVFEVSIWGPLWRTQEVWFYPSSFCPASWGLEGAPQGSDENEPEDVRIFKKVHEFGGITDESFN